MATRSTLTEMWDTRPPRIPRDQGGKAVIGGVCEGIGVRYRIDPTFIRVIFVALALAFGGGIFVYLLCWINMPRVGMTRSPWNAVITPGEDLTSAETKERRTGWWLLLGMLVFFPSMSVAGDARAALVAFFLFFTGWYFAHQGQPEPPAGLATDSAYWPLPERVHQTPPRMRPLWLWLPITVVLSAVTMFVLGVASELRLGNYSRFGSVDVTVRNIDQVPDLDEVMGETRLDLSRLEPLSEPRTLDIRKVAGTVEITLPEDIPVDVNCEVTIGETACPDETQNADMDGGLLTINVRQLAGSVSAYYGE